MMKNLAYGSLLIIAAMALASCRSGGEEAKGAGKKFNTGHYVCIGPRSALDEILHLDEPALHGAIKRYFWRDLEPEPGAYDFTEIESDLGRLGSLGKRLIVFAMDKSFSAKSALPAYLREFETLSGTNDYSPVRWHPRMIERFTALGVAIGKRFDGRENFEGIAMQESALTITEEGYGKFGYSPKKYADSLIRILRDWQGAMPSGRVFWFSNFIPDGNNQLHRIADALKGSGIVMGGPDVLPYNPDITRASYGMYEKYHGRLPLFCSAQGDSFKHHKNDVSVSVVEPLHEEGYLTMEEIFLFARDRLHIDYLFWDYVYEDLLPGQRNYDDALAVMRKYPSWGD
jgi:hypothetical protein